MGQSIRFRLTAWYVAALAFTLVLLGIATYLLTRASLHHWLDETLQERVEALTEEVRLVGDEPRLDLPERPRRAYEGLGDGFVLLDGSGRVAMARGLDDGSFRGGPLVERSFTGKSATGTI